MKYTNKHNLPEPIVRGILDHEYGGKGEVKFASVTELIKPAHQRQLEKTHWDKLEVDLSSKLWQVAGNAFHLYFEKYNKDASEVMTEERLSIDIDGKTITGGIDLYYKDKDGKYILTDFKNTNTYKYVNNDFDDFDIQVNCYALMLRHIGYQVDEMRCSMYFRDWMASRVGKKGHYPVIQFHERIIPLINEDKLLQWIRERMDRIINAESGNITDCTPDERWQTEDVFAVMKNNNKNATKLCDTMTEAEEYIGNINKKNPKDGYTVQYRPGERKRCIHDYCPACEHCESYEAYMASKEGK